MVSVNALSNQPPRRQRRNGLLQQDEPEDFTLAWAELEHQELVHAFDAGEHGRAWAELRASLPRVETAETRFALK